MSENWKCITPPTQSFAGLPVCTQLNDLEADIAIIGLHYVSPYPQRLPATSAKTVVETAPDAIRRQSMTFIDHLDHYDFDFDDALAFGSIFIRAREVHREGIDACLVKIPAADHYLITIDADVFDTAIAPGVLFPSPGGLTFEEITYLVRGIARKGSVAGVNLFGIRPELDINDLTASTGAQLIINFIGTLAHSGQIGK